MKKAEAKIELEKLEARKKELVEIISKPEITKEQRFLELINGLTIKIDKEKYPNSTFFFKGDEVFLEIEKSIMWVRWKYIWSVFESEFSMKYEQIQSFISDQVEEHFKMKGLTPGTKQFDDEQKVEEHFKMKGLTPDQKK